MHNNQTLLHVTFSPKTTIYSLDHCEAIISVFKTPYVETSEVKVSAVAVGASLETKGCKVMTFCVAVVVFPLVLPPSLSPCVLPLLKLQSHNTNLIN